MSALRDENLSWGQEVTPRQTRQFSTPLLPLLYRCLLGCVEQAVGGRCQARPSVRPRNARVRLTAASHGPAAPPWLRTAAAPHRALHPPVLVAVFVR